MEFLRGRNSARFRTGDLVIRLTNIETREPFVNGCLVQGEAMTLRVPTYRAIDINGNVGRPFQPLLMPVTAISGEQCKLFEVSTRASMGQGMLRTGASMIYNDRALTIMKVPSVIRSTDGAVLGAVCTAQNKLGVSEPDGGGTRSLIAYSTQPLYESQEPVDVRFDGSGTSGVPMFRWVKQSCSPVSHQSTGSNTQMLYLANANGGFEQKPTYTFLKRDAALFHDIKVPWKADPFTVTEVESGAKVATSRVCTQKAGPEPGDFVQCWHEVDVVPGMDASLVALAVVMDGLLVDELAYREPN